VQKRNGSWISEIEQSLQVEFERLRAKIRTVQTTKEDGELVERLRNLSTVVDELPVWPFDASTLRKFLTAYTVPLAVSLLGKLAPISLEWFRRLLDK
jgi:hypothetical protein